VVVGNATPRGGISQQDARELHSRAVPAPYPLPSLVLFLVFFTCKQSRGGLDTHWFCIRWCVAAFLLEETSRNQSGRRGFAGTSYCPFPDSLDANTHMNTNTNTNSHKNTNTKIDIYSGKRQGGGLQEHVFVLILGCKYKHKYKHRYTQKYKYKDEYQYRCGREGAFKNEVLSFSFEAECHTYAPKVRSMPK